MKPIICKFRLYEWKNSEGAKKNEETGDYEQCIKSTILFNPVRGDSPENQLFWEASPSGSFELGHVDPEAISELELLKDYYVIITSDRPPELGPLPAA